MKNPIIKYAALHALGAAIYISLIAILMNSAGKILGPDKTVLPGIAFLLTFVISAAVMGLTIFGRPIMWYLNGKKNEGIKLAIYTILFLAIIAIIFFLILLSTALNARFPNA